MQKEYEYTSHCPNIQKSAPRRIRTKRINLNQVHEATNRDKRRRMVNPQENEEQFIKRISLESDARRYVPPYESQRNYFKYSREVTPTEKDRINQNVDIYLQKLKTKVKPQSISMIPRELKINEIPYQLSGPSTQLNAPRVSKRISQEFDKKDFYSAEYKPLTPVNSNLFVYQAFRDYIENNRERVPSMMLDEDERERKFHCSRNRNPRTARNKYQFS